MTTPTLSSSPILGDATTTQRSAGGNPATLDLAMLARLEQCVDLAGQVVGPDAMQIIDTAARHTIEQARQAFSMEADRR